tara:strand:+ start:6091 stop:6543 length:453 start_codon:yes stop_codon:yes gene_type:complete
MELSVELKNDIDLLQKTLVDSGSNKVFIGKKTVEIAPLEHSFCDGIYVREMKAKAGTFLIGKVHKQDHVWMLMSGSLIIITEDGLKEVKGPMHGTADKGTKRVAYVKEDCVFVNVMLNVDNTKDIDLIESRAAVDTFEEYNSFLIENKNK